MNKMVLNSSTPKTKPKRATINSLVRSLFLLLLLALIFSGVPVYGAPPLATSCVAPKIRLAGLIPKGPYLDRNEYILESFGRWLEKQEIHPERYRIAPKAQRDALLAQFTRIQETIFSENRQKFAQLSQNLLNQKILDAKKNPQTVLFQGKKYPVKAILGDGREATSFLIQKDQELRVLKVFHSHVGTEHFQAHAALLSKLQALGVPNSKIIEADFTHNALLLSYAPGLTSDDIVNFSYQGIVSHDLRVAYGFHHARFANSIMDKVGKEISTYLDNPWLFNPHGGNVSYDPLLNTWTLFDPH